MDEAICARGREVCILFLCFGEGRFNLFFLKPDNDSSRDIDDWHGELRGFFDHFLLQIFIMSDVLVLILNVAALEIDFGHFAERTSDRGVDDRLSHCFFLITLSPCEGRVGKR